MDRPLPADDKRDGRRANKRQAILDGAVRVFAEKGFFTATVAEIARMAGVADGTIYLYFKNKDDLLLSIFDEKMAALSKAAGEIAASSPSASEALRRICALQLRAVEEHPNVAAVLIVELRQSAAFVRDAEKPRLAEYLDVIGDIVKQGQASGEFRAGVHPGAVKRALFGAWDELALGWLLGRKRFNLVQSAAEITDVFVRGLVAREESK